MATHCRILAWRIQWMEEPGGLQSIGSQRVGHDWRNWACTHIQSNLHNPQDHNLLQWVWDGLRQAQNDNTVCDFQDGEAAHPRPHGWWVTERVWEPQASRVKHRKSKPVSGSFLLLNLFFGSPSKWWLGVVYMCIPLFPCCSFKRSRRIWDYIFWLFLLEGIPEEEKQAPSWDLDSDSNAWMLPLQLFSSFIDA